VTKIGVLTHLEKRHKIQYVLSVDAPKPTVITCMCT